MLTFDLVAPLAQQKSEQHFLHPFFFLELSLNAQNGLENILEFFDCARCTDVFVGSISTFDVFVYVFCVGSEVFRDWILIEPEFNSKLFFSNARLQFDVFQVASSINRGFCEEFRIFLITSSMR